MNQQNNYWLIIFVFALVSCGPKVVYETNINISDTGWHKDSVAVFKSEVTELNRDYHLLLQPNVNMDYAYNNIWFFIDAISPSGHIQRDTVSCYLSAVDGEMYGNKQWFSDDYISVQPYKLNIRFPEKGVYTYRIAQGMRDENIMGLNSIGLKIIEVE